MTRLNQSLDRGLDVLELLDPADRDLGVRDMARQLALSPAIVQRLINTLAQRGYLLRNPETRRYRLGYRAVGLGAGRSRRDDLLSLAQGELRRLASEHCVSAFLGALKQGRAVYVVAVQGESPITLRVRVGDEMPLHSTAIGKILLASLDVAGVRRVLGRRPLTRLTERTVTDPEKLLRSLERVRSQGFATVREENLPGVLSVGAPVHDTAGQVIAAISIAYPRSLDPAMSIEAMTPHVLGAAERVSRGLGWRGHERLTAAE